MCRGAYSCRVKDRVITNTHAWWRRSSVLGIASDVPIRLAQLKMAKSLADVGYRNPSFCHVSPVGVDALHSGLPAVDTTTQGPSQVALHRVAPRGRLP